MYAGKSFYLNPDDLIQTETNLYLKLDYYSVFGLQGIFNFRSLSVIIKSVQELPVIREMRLEAMRNNVRQLKGDLKADTSIAMNRPLFHFGMADWSVATNQVSEGNKNTRVNLALGAVIAGGETTVALNYDNFTKISEKQQYYLWRLVNNDHSALRQVMAGKIYTQASATIYNPVVGVQFTNTPTTYRRSFGSYILSEHTEPNWMVELYVNNVLVNYIKADASGFFTFEVPLVYGNSVVKLRYYGPWGEERSSEQNINIPFNFLPLHKLEYTVSGGFVEDTAHSQYSRANFNYGLGRKLTIGGGIEYLSTVINGKNMPFVNASARLASNLLLSSEYIYRVRMKNVLSYRLPYNLQLDITYSKYTKGQKAIDNTFLEERKAVLSVPYRSERFSLYSRFTFYQIVSPSTTYTNAEALFSGVLFGVNTNFTTYAILNGNENTYLYSNLSSTLRLPGKLLLTPQAQYEYTQKKFMSIKAELSRQLTYRGYANILYENNFMAHYQSIGIGFRYDFAFTQLSFFAKRGNNVTTTTETARGSLMFNGETNYVGFNTRASVGKGGLIISPFLDLNANGKKDKNEPKVYGLKVQLNAGLIKYNKDTTVLITDLESYTGYILRLNTDAIDNVAWQIKNKNIGVSISPNQLRLLEIPVAVSGEVSGTVFVNESKGRKGLGRILVSFFNSASQQVAQVTTESDGFFSFLGLPPGTYYARVDTVQLAKLHFASSPAEISFKILVSREGTVVDGLEFILLPLAGNVEAMAEARQY